MIKIELKEDEISAVLDRVSAALTDMSPVMERIGDDLLSGTDQRFRDGIAPDGSAWAPKSAATLEAYRRGPDSVSFRPLIGPSKSLSTTISFRAGADFVEIGSNAVYAAVMQFGAAKGAFGTTSRGSPIPWGDIPARPFLGISDTDRSNIITTVTEWLERLAGGAA